MPSIEPFIHLLGINTSILTTPEKILLEAELFERVCNKLKEIFRKQYHEYFSLINFSKKKEDLMLDQHFVRFIINDILESEEYSIKGIAYYTNTFQDVLEELATGCNTNPSAFLFRKLIFLHQSVRRSLYDYIIKKIITEYTTLSNK